MKRSNLPRAVLFSATVAAALWSAPTLLMAQTVAKPVAQQHPAPPSSATVEQHITQLHTQLGITPAEQVQWDAFAQVMRDNADQMSAAFSERGSGVTNMSALDNMQSYARLAQVHAANMQKLASAFEPLYESFSDQQKKRADQVFQASARTPARGS
jgi:hypothetical protein